MCPNPTRFPFRSPATAAAANGFASYGPAGQLAVSVPDSMTGQWEDSYAAAAAAAGQRSQSASISPRHHPYSTAMGGAVHPGSAGPAGPGNSASAAAAAAAAAGFTAANGYGNMAAMGPPHSNDFLHGPGDWKRECSLPLILSGT